MILWILLLWLYFYCVLDLNYKIIKLSLDDSISNIIAPKTEWISWLLDIFCINKQTRILFNWIKRTKIFHHSKAESQESRQWRQIQEDNSSKKAEHGGVSLSSQQAYNLTFTRYTCTYTATLLYMVTNLTHTITRIFGPIHLHQFFFFFWKYFGWDLLPINYGTIKAKAQWRKVNFLYLCYLSSI